MCKDVYMCDMHCMYIGLYAYILIRRYMHMYVCMMGYKDSVSRLRLPCYYLPTSQRIILSTSRFSRISMLRKPMLWNTDFGQFVHTGESLRPVVTTNPS